MSNFLDGFELMSLHYSSHPGPGKPRMTVSKSQFSFSKELVEALNCPKHVDVFKGKGENKIAITAGTSLHFASKGKQMKIIRSKPEILNLFHSILDFGTAGTYYCINAEFVNDDGKLYAVLDLDKAERYVIAESIIRKLGRKPTPEAQIKEMDIPTGR